MYLPHHHRRALLVEQSMAADVPVWGNESVGAQAKKAVHGCLVEYFLVATRQLASSPKTATGLIRAVSFPNGGAGFTTTGRVMGPKR